jgi:hypothetical protein
MKMNSGKNTSTGLSNDHIFAKNKYSIYVEHRKMGIGM